jgi:hypothetical protein
MLHMVLRMMNQNPHLLPPMQDPRIMQQAMQVMQQQQQAQARRRRPRRARRRRSNSTLSWSTNSM